MLTRPKMRRLLAVLAILALTAAACGDSDTPTSDGLPLSVEGLIVAEPTSDVSVIGFIVADSAGSRLCEALAESFPPQCGGMSVEISGLDDLDPQLEEAQGLRWTGTAVVVTGRYSGGTLAIVSVG
jgi:hypothetical protein